MAPVAEGPHRVCPTFVGECCTCLDVQITMQCVRAGYDGYCRMCPVDLVMDLPQISRLLPPEFAVDAWPLAERLIGSRQGSRDVQEGRLLRWRARIDRLTWDEIRWTPYDTPGIQALIPNWMRSQGEVHTWRSAVPVVCFIRQYGGEQPVPRHPVDVTRFMNSTARGDDVWWPTRLQTWYDRWGRRRSPEVMVTVHACGDQRGTRQYYDWYVGAAAGIRFLTRVVDLNDPRWNMAPPNLPAEHVHARDELTMPDDAPAPRRRTTREPPPRMAVPARGRVRCRDQCRRTRMLLAGAAAHMDEERAEEEQEYAEQEEVGPGDEAHDQAGGDVGGEAAHPDLGFQSPFRSGSPSAFISFSPKPARQFPSPYHAETSSGPQIVHEQQGEFTPQTQDQAGLDVAY
ncbi:hypothetical protein PIB30_047278 [Stylosanthes scabra]|uniref:Aminotransferase-like plant mobile domain-containing protein n=1 Tax=Stylosanthes scabra TaxID=79078 RepID=A0ABU6TIW0_9FABA|nr:hypothetical protein [Stylosanthes scabra]